MMEALVAGLVLALVGQNYLWLRHTRFMVNTAVARNPVELASREQVARDPRPQQQQEKLRTRPDGI